MTAPKNDWKSLTIRAGRFRLIGLQFGLALAALPTFTATAGPPQSSAGPLQRVARQLHRIESERLALHVAGSPNSDELLSRGDHTAFDISARPLMQPFDSPVVTAAEFGGDLTLVGRAARGELRSDLRRPLPGFWETVDRDLRAWPGVFWEDTKKVYTNRSNLIILGLTYGASLAVQETGPDETVANSFETHRTFKSDFRDAFGALGNPGTHFGLAGLWYLVGQRQQDERTYTVGTKLFRALAVTGVSTLLGKALTWDNAPNGEFGSFPSGHAASTFAFASVLHAEYGPWVGGPLYGLGALVAYERLESGEHHLSDVIMGGVMGLVIGHTVAADGEPPSIFGGDLVPYVDPDTRSSGIAWVTRLP